jgi:hypothetical protein
MKLVPDPVLDAPEAEETWGCYPCRCQVCGLEMQIVATRHSIDFGYAEMMPDDATCSDCLRKEPAR